LNLKFELRLACHWPQLALLVLHVLGLLHVRPGLTKALIVECWDYYTGPEKSWSSSFDFSGSEKSWNWTVVLKHHEQSCIFLQCCPW